MPSILQTCDKQEAQKENALGFTWMSSPKMSLCSSPIKQCEKDFENSFAPSRKRLKEMDNDNNSNNSIPDLHTMEGEVTKPETPPRQVSHGGAVAKKRKLASGKGIFKKHNRMV